MLKRFFIWLIKNLVVLLAVTLIFSSITLELPDLIKGIFGDIFERSSPEMQKEVAGKLALACSALDDKSLGALQATASNSPLPIDLSKVGALCKEHNSGKINDKQFFFSVIGSALSGKLEAAETGALQKYNAAINFLNKNKAAYAIAIAVLLTLLALLAGSLSSFLSILSGISLSMGIMILLPYAAIILYEKFEGIDTTPILASILGGGVSFDAKAVISVILLAILRTYTSLIITLGFIFLGTGVGGKLHGWLAKKRELGEPASKKAKEAKVSEKEKRREQEREKSAKDILDELEEMHKKRVREKKEP